MLAELRAKKLAKEKQEQEKQAGSGGPKLDINNVLKTIRPTVTPAQIAALKPSPARTGELVQALMEKTAGPLAAQVHYNGKQQEFIDWVANWEALDRDEAGNITGKRRELVFIGAAGTGKTTSERGAQKRLLADPSYPIMRESSKYLSYEQTGIAMVSYTNKAVAQQRRNTEDSLKPQCLTIHKLIEFEPEFYEVINPESGEVYNKMRFVPKRNQLNRLPRGLKTILIDEASMVDERLHAQLTDAIHVSTNIVYIGDLNQLPPVFGDSILGRKLIECPVIELTEIYRQAADSPIIKFAWDILEGKWNLFSPRDDKDENGKFYIPSFKRLTDGSGGKIKIIPWAKKINSNVALMTVVKRFTTLFDQGKYIPEEDMILIPYNVQMGTIEANKGIAQHLGKVRGAIVHEVISGIGKHYYAVGDKVLYMKEEYQITEIVRNGNYVGQAPLDPSTNLDRWGNYREKPSPEEMLGDSMMDIDALLESVTLTGEEDDKERFNQASHIIKIENLFDRTIKYELQTAGDVNSLLFAYAITVHKSQGSEWRKVYLVLHHSHKTMHFRELLYTAVTRAREELEIICEPNSLERCIKNPRIKGNTLKEKLAYLKERFAAKDRKLEEGNGDDDNGDDD